MLVNQLIEDYTKQWDLPQMTVAPDAMQALQEHGYPGNTSELKTIIQNAVTLAEGDTIGIKDLQFTVSTNALVPSSNDTIVTQDLEQYLEEIERYALTQALESTRWNKTGAGAKLGISFRAFPYRCKKLGID